MRWGGVKHVLSGELRITNSWNTLLALWRVEQNQLSDIITLVAKCSLEIQEKFGIYHTREGQDLQLKIGLSAGRISQVIVGDERQQYLLVIGQDVDDVQLAQRLAQANEIVLSWKCWMLCEQYMFEVEIMREDEAVKGCMFLCVFGLPGDKKPDECAHALESSFSIFSFCWENLAKTKLVSISITNGPVFSGVVGAVARHEYTVIGPKVSLAARMITAYPGLVSCDEVTYLRYMLPACNFKKLPEKMMKNISNPGKIYEYLGHKRCIMFGKRHLARKRNKNHPLLDRKKELEAFQMAQQGCLHQKKGQAVLYEGGKGCGKASCWLK
ncbi:adenylate cyclase type 10-like [Pongo abelii]|uniref:adenylate cyclase type 10-like n=1 Tax=Pongo abelii TaxID=9601 RepID=UPI0023E82FDF|nr:adenylate cyclase type 10-like [Pongo abelii]